MNRYAEVCAETNVVELVDVKSKEVEGVEPRALTVTEMDAVGGGNLVNVLF